MKSVYSHVDEGDISDEIILFVDKFIFSMFCDILLC